ncbi:MAG: TatD family deoxyribonuclease [Dehalococcoidia bacterium]|nr:TatD family deoxyribonuclease [Dehalococcoidia bacterium]
MTPPAAVPPPLLPLDAPLVDAHAHISSREFDDDRSAVLERAWDAGLVAIVEAGTDSASSERALASARAQPSIHATAGLHPHDASRLEAERGPLRVLLTGGGFAAVGEIGLDFYRELSSRAEQYAALRWQLALARELVLPVVIHAREADAECYAELTVWAAHAGRYLGPGREIGMLHCFAGDPELAARYIELGFLISVPGTVTYPGSERGRAVARMLPLPAMLVETDCPYLPPQPYRGRRNEPAYVRRTVQAVAELRACSAEEVARATAQNAARLFGFTLPASVTGSP